VRGGYGIFLNQWAYSVQPAFARNLPFFFTKQVDVPADVRVPTLQTRNILRSDATGTVGGSIMDHAYNVEYSQTWSGGYANVDVALAKTWDLAGRSRLEFRWEVFNLFNRTNFDLPNRVFGTPNFGRIFSAKNPREMPFGLRLGF
jgi:hypothetical protein